MSDKRLSPRRQRRRQARTREILKVAGRILQRDGLEGLTFKRIADDIDVATSGLYRYFPTKGHLLVALQLSAVEQILHEVRHVRKGADMHCQGLAPKVRVLFELLLVAGVYQRFARDRPDEFRNIALALADPLKIPPLEQLSDLWQQWPEQFAGSIFQQAEQCHALEPGNRIQRAIIFWLSVHSSLSLRPMQSVARGAFDARQLADEATDTLLRGWGAEAALVARARVAVAEFWQSSGSPPD